LDTPGVEDHVPSHALPLVLMSSSDGRVIPGTDGTFLLLFACGIPPYFGKQVKAYHIAWSTVFPMNCSSKYLIGVDWNHWMMNIVGTTGVDGTIYCKFAEDGDMLCLNGQLI
jgi:hypothetical protein